jgi:hypothetical protein
VIATQKLVYNRNTLENIRRERRDVKSLSILPAAALFPNLGGRDEFKGEKLPGLMKRFDRNPLSGFVNSGVVPQGRNLDLQAPQVVILKMRANRVKLGMPLAPNLDINHALCIGTSPGRAGIILMGFMPEQGQNVTGDREVCLKGETNDKDQRNNQEAAT